MDEERIVCKTPTPGKQPTRILKWKYDLVRDKILAIVDQNPEGVSFKDLPGLVGSKLTSEEVQRLGSISWYVTTVKLHMEVEGDIERIPYSTPQKLKRKI